jgi:F0F1-type ATP synthase assembly protein I
VTRNILWLLRGIAVTAFIAFAALILVSINPLVWRWDGFAGPLTALVEFAGALRDGLSLLVAFLIFVAASLGALIDNFFSQQPTGVLFQQYYDAIAAYFQALGFTLPPLPIDPVILQAVVTGLLQSVYFLGFQVLLIIGLTAGILSFLRVSGRLALLCFLSMTGIAILAAAGILMNLPGGEYGYLLAPVSTFPMPVNPILWLSSSVFVVAIVSFLYLEVSYQVVYFNSLLEPPSIREEQLRQQLQQLQTDAQRQVPVQSQDIPIPKALQRMLGSDAFRLMRQVIERKLLRREWLVELKDAHEIRRLNTFVSRVFREDPEAEAALTAHAATPSIMRMTTLSIGSSLIRFTLVIIIAYICINPVIFLTLLGAPGIIIESVELWFLLEKVIIFLLPLVLLFPLTATLIGYIRQRRKQSIEEAIQTSSQ